MNAIKEKLEIEYLKSLTYTEINEKMNMLKDKINEQAKALQLLQTDVSSRREQLIAFADAINVCDGDNKKIGKLVDLYLKSN